MPTFSLRHPYFVILLCLFICALGVTSIIQMPVDTFPPISISVVLVAMFYNGMPPEQIEADVTDNFERFFTWGSSFTDPFLIMLAVPTGLIGVILTLVLALTSLNIRSRTDIVMLQGMVVSNSILIVDFANGLRGGGRSLRDAVVQACHIRLSPVLMTPLATVVGLLPMALKIETGSKAYAPFARATIGGG